MSAIQREYADRGFRLVAISSNDAERYPADSFEAMKQHASEQGFPFDYLYDADQSVARVRARAYAGGLPLRLRAPARLPRRDRRLAGRGRGVRALPPRNAIEAALEGGEPTTRESPPVGCTVKWKG